MNVYTKTKIQFKFGSLEIVCVEMRSKKLFKLSLKLTDTLEFRCIYVHALTHVNASYIVIRL